MYGVSPSANGIAAFRKQGGSMRVYVQRAVDSRIVAMYYNSNSGWRPEESFGETLVGSPVAAFLDDAENMHVYYQSDKSPYPVREAFWDGTKWNFGGFRPSAAQGVQFAALFATGVPGAYDNSRPTAQFFSTNNQLYPYVTWAPYSGLGGAPGSPDLSLYPPPDYHCGLRWCSPWSMAETSSPRSRLAVTSQSGVIRVYYFTKNGKLGEIRNTNNGTVRLDATIVDDYYGTGWSVTNWDILSALT